ncbi:tat (twin-arginine translocation) pathway signal sequence [Streptomyces sp. DSM 41982]|uniref:Tat (Twin-arginine translocation) pathway signal sequence n=1 Tax=Streptomyces evansiae TaxID=3075535 RepID=A0ABD5E2H9_9ACTN|nr:MULTISPECIES: tat (twin-arginine translocation) pathway signal sequence [unclassified Streptomyces]MDT0415283.1 tat (twin-arginine translocation) pathway signal sequence [Streptomyces sp. DSM 41982]SCD58333.1 hypothetical protein GA0115246_103425 [Streptomyces sp. SolWspMP-sol7th]
MHSRALSALRRPGVLAALTATLLLAFFTAPNALARDTVNTSNVAPAFRSGFAAYWNAGDAEQPAGLRGTVDFWFRFHVVKAGVSALLLAAAVALGVVLWRRLRAREGRRALLVLSATGTGALGLFALVALMANVQGAAAPFSSLMPMLGADNATLAQVGERLAADPSGAHSPVLAAMIGDFATYHAVLAVAAALVALAAATATVLLRRRRAPRLAPAATALLTLAALVLAFANTTSAFDSPAALAAFTSGSW